MFELGIIGGAEKNPEPIGSGFFIEDCRLYDFRSLIFAYKVKFPGL